MRLARTIAEARAAVALLRRGGSSIGFVPTMGALHAGHGSLIERAGRAGAVVLSIFVNPLQFGPGEDLAEYPRDLQGDTDVARSWGVAALWAPAAEELVPSRLDVSVDPGPLGDELEGRARPGHFRGVLTIVAKLLNVVRPDVAVFGQKDLQQAVLVRAMIRDLDFDVEMDVAPTVREADGLALSSRNAYLSEEERARATVLFRALQAGERRIHAGERRAGGVRDEMLRVLADEIRAGVDYVAVRRADDLGETHEVAGPAALLGAIRIGRTRLIDNLLVHPGPREGIHAQAGGTGA